MAKPDTRLKMIHTAIDLFHRQGVNATSVDEILEASKTGKGQFTHYFKNKEGLVRAAIGNLSEEIRAGRVPTGYRVESWKQLERWFRTYLDFQESVDFTRSCPIGTIGNDLIESKSELRADVVAFLDWSRAELTSFFERKLEEGELVPAAKPQALADLCIAVMQGGMLLTKIKRNPDMFDAAAKQTLTFIQGLRVKGK